MDEYFVDLTGQIEKAKEYYEGASNCVEQWTILYNDFVSLEVYVTSVWVSYFAVGEDINHFVAYDLLTSSN